VVLTHALPSTSQTSYEMLPEVNQELLEKPSFKEENMRMLLDLNGGVCEVVTGVVVGPYATFVSRLTHILESQYTLC
jgi:septum formation protein